MQEFTMKFNIILGLASAALFLGACDDAADGDLVEVVDIESGRVGYMASTPAAAEELLGRVESGELTGSGPAIARLSDDLGMSGENGESSPRALPACPNTNASAETAAVSFGIWGMQYRARAVWKKIGFGPHRPVRAEVTVCGDGCVHKNQLGTPLDVLVTQMIPLSLDVSVYASARIIDHKNGEDCIAASAVQYWP
jgi:hypothetical protein